MGICKGIQKLKTQCAMFNWVISIMHEVLKRCVWKSEDSTPLEWWQDFCPTSQCGHPEKVSTLVVYLVLLKRSEHMCEAHPMVLPDSAHCERRHRRPLPSIVIPPVTLQTTFNCVTWSPYVCVCVWLIHLPATQIRRSALLLLLQLGLQKGLCKQKLHRKAEISTYKEVGCCVSWRGVDVKFFWGRMTQQFRSCVPWHRTCISTSARHFRLIPFLILVRPQRRLRVALGANA